MFALGLILTIAYLANSHVSYAQNQHEPFQNGRVILLAARPNPYNRGNCFQWKKCLGETIGNMWVATAGYCGPLGGKSWKDQQGRCIDLADPPWSTDPSELSSPGRSPRR
jgi:hypothetical protein